MVLGLQHVSTGSRKDELERVKAAGARVLTLEQLDGLRVRPCFLPARAACRWGPHNKHPVGIAADAALAFNVAEAGVFKTLNVSIAGAAGPQHPGVGGGGGG